MEPIPRPDQNAVVLDRTVLEAEVGRLVDAADGAGLTLRVLGSLGVALHCEDARELLPAFDKTYADIDLAAYGRDARAIAGMLGGLGYHDDRDIYATSEGRRSIFDDPARGIHVDVFYDRLEFCHTIPIAGRLAADRPTIPLTELLLSKLQIVRINSKDVVDIVLLLLDHPLARGDDGVIDVDRIARLCGDDWGLWRTMTLNLEKVSALAATYPQLRPDQAERVRSAAAEIKARIDAAPKSLAWRLRDRVGDRRQWWVDVDEVR